VEIEKQKEQNLIVCSSALDQQRLDAIMPIRGTTFIFWCRSGSGS
jgi:hypothetical protein